MRFSGSRVTGTAGIAGGVFHVARLAAVIVLLMAGVGIETVMLAHVAGRLAEIAWCRMHLPVPLARGFRLSMPAVTRLVAPSFLNAVCLRAMDSLDLLLLSALGASAAALGHYSAALMLAQLPRIVNFVVAPGLIAALSKAAGAGNAALGEALKEDAFRLVALAAAMILVAAGAAPTLLVILFGREFVDGAMVLRILLAGGVGVIVFTMSSAEAVAEGKAWWPLAVSLPVLALDLALLLWLVPQTRGGRRRRGVRRQLRRGGPRASRDERCTRARRVRHLIAGLAAGIAGGGLAAVLAARGLMILDGVAGALLALAMLYAGGVIDRGMSPASQASSDGGGRRKRMADHAYTSLAGDPRLSVVIVGRDGIQSLRPILACLTEQTIADRMEVIAVLPSDRFADDALDPWATHFQSARAVATGVIGNRGRAAAAGVRVATAPVIAFTENHCFPDPDWAERLCLRHDETGAGGSRPRS